MNLFGKNAGKVYASKYEVVASRNFSDEEKEAIKKATVVDSEYGLSVCFALTRGGSMYYPLSTESKLKLGDNVDMETTKVLTLMREGDDKPLTRIQEA